MSFASKITHGFVLASAVTLLLYDLDEDTILVERASASASAPLPSDDGLSVLTSESDLAGDSAWDQAPTPPVATPSPSAPER